MLPLPQAGEGSIRLADREAYSNRRLSTKKAAGFPAPIAAVRRNFAGRLVIGRDLMEV